MNLRDLQYLVALADHRHFGRAAEASFVSQPTLSTQVRKLEEELGVALVERAPRNVMLTPAGRDMAERAYAALDLRGWARVDFMRDGDGRNWLLEANTAPGMTSHSLMPKSAAALDVSFEELCWRILEQTVPGRRA